MSAEERARLAERVASIARAAGREILRIYGQGASHAQSKPDNSPLTEADLRSQRLIADALRALTPDIPLLSEEAARAPYAERSKWRQYWLVDPLDGTREFLSRNGEFTVNIALIEAHVPVLGVVHVPVTDRTYAGIPGAAAWRYTGAGAGRQMLHVAARSAEPVRVVGSRSHRGDSLEQFLARLGPHQMKPVGSSLKFCLVAEGAADVYPRLGPTREWDTAAAHAVVTAAGGAVVQLDGRPLEYNTRDELLNPFFVAYGDTQRDWLALLR
ncbi:MAG TPA: 3'(2'),5'-bisphosphate nucleotidase CysQ [Steroidobacteraceae bacterium]|jgi:3'(2'), 5'-bisphosphate nucleotidase|nr:3'(2'),5'-bisphosphate nucleotidase CysQ [Steroidobacteraceae bacterium]